MPRLPRVFFAALGLGVVASAVTGCASGAADAPPADRSAIAERASSLGIDPDLVYTTDVDGYDLAPQSVGTAGEDGMSATWFAADTGHMISVRTERGAPSAASCAATPLWDAPEAPVTCTEEDGVWHRTGGGTHEYLVARDDASIRILGVGGAPAEDLRAAATAVHVPSDAELALLFLDAPDGAATPVPRGDLPENGDGAPIQPTGPGG